MQGVDIAGCLARNLFERDLVVVDQCSWPGHECDLLVLTKRLQVIDVEVKISRADLKRDRAKAKWYDVTGWGPDRKAMPRAWPIRVWKHYYAMPAELFKPELLELCHPTSGVIVVDDTGGHPPDSRGRRKAQLKNPKHWRHDVIRRAQPCLDYVPVTAAEVVAIARLASLRMWDAYHDYAVLAREKSGVEADAPDPLQVLVDALGALPKRLRDSLAGDRMLARARQMLPFTDIPADAVGVDVQRDGVVVMKHGDAVVGITTASELASKPARISRRVLQGESGPTSPLEGELLPRRGPPTPGRTITVRKTAAVGKTTAQAPPTFDLQPSPDKTGTGKKRIRGSK